MVQRQEDRAVDVAPLRDQPVPQRRHPRMARQVDHAARLDEPPESAPQPLQHGQRHDAPIAPLRRTSTRAVREPACVLLMLRVYEETARRHAFCVAAELNGAFDTA